MREPNVEKEQNRSQQIYRAGHGKVKHTLVLTFYDGKLRRSYLRDILLGKPCYAFQCGL